MDVLIFLLGCIWIIWFLSDFRFCFPGFILDFELLLFIANTKMHNIAAIFFCFRYMGFSFDECMNWEFRPTVIFLQCF
jgi:hypothetical protein